MKIAVYFLDAGREPAAVMASMTESMRRFDHLVEATYPVAGGAVRDGFRRAVINNAEVDHPDVNHDGVSAVIRSDRSDAVTEAARRLSLSPGSRSPAAHVNGSRRP